MIKVSVKFEQWLEAEVNRRDRENKKMDNMTDRQRDQCCDNHSAHEESILWKFNEAVEIWNKWLEITKRGAP